MNRRYFSAAMMAAFACLTAVPADAMTNSQLARKSLLKISNAMAGTETVMSVDELKAIPSSTLVTKTPWTDGTITFEGVYFKDLVERFGADAVTAQATAFNDYQIRFDVAEIVAKDGFIAFSRDGNNLSRRDKGPYWLVFPWTDRPDLDSREVHGLSIWQLVSLNFN